MHPHLTTKNSKNDILVLPIRAKELAHWLKTQDASTQQWVTAQEYKAKPGTICTLPGQNGALSRVLLGVTKKDNLWNWAALADLAPGGYTYYCENKELLADAALGWMLSTYRFTRYKAAPKTYGKLRLPEKFEIAELDEIAAATFLIRDLINRPANDLTPSALAESAQQLAKECGASFHQIIGEDLLKQNYPTIHAVGRACSDAPRLIELGWNTTKKSLPLVTLVGKGVCFDTGGLNIKTGSGMGLMKKDMGGAAHVLGLARLIIKRNLSVRLRVLIPAVENSISGNSFRPQDVIKTRKGLSVEIGNTDAEGRLILCDALAEADNEKPDLLIDMATLTGASRVALGPDIPSFFTPSDALAKEIESVSIQTADPLWRLPLWQPYEEYLNSTIADINNAGTNSYAGAITAALFLKRFVTHTKNWLHIDVMAWNITAKPGRPIGGEAQGLRALYTLLKTRYS